MPTDATDRVCPSCRFAYQSRQGRCWLCGEPLPPIDQAPRAEAPVAAELVENPYATPPSSVAGHSNFALSTLFLIVTLAAVCCGVTGLAPGLGVPLAVISVLALVRTAAVSRRQAGTTGLSTGEKFAAFASSALLVAVILLAAAIAFLAACTVACFGTAAATNREEVALGAGAVVGGIAAIVMTVMLFRLTWPRRRPPGPPQSGT